MKWIETVRFYRHVLLPVRFGHGEHLSIGPWYAQSAILPFRPAWQPPSLPRERQTETSISRSFIAHSSPVGQVNSLIFRLSCQAIAT